LASVPLDSSLLGLPVIVLPKQVLFLLIVPCYPRSVACRLQPSVQDEVRCLAILTTARQGSLNRFGKNVYTTCLRRRLCTVTDTILILDAHHLEASKATPVTSCHFHS
jgi:hypothetical protein